MQSMSIEQWEPYFKPEVRSAGRALSAKGMVSVSRGSDTQIQCFIRGSSPQKVTFSSESIDSPILLAACNCSLSKKGQTCKHMWASLLQLEETGSDILDSKNELITTASASSREAGKKPLSESQIAYQQKRAISEAAYKEKQANYRKQHYQSQKQKMDAKKGKSSKLTPAPSFPDHVEEALKYFEINGFHLRTTLTSEDIGVARKKLARVFHPDKGGSHEEITELNNFAEILLEFAQS